MLTIDISVQFFLQLAAILATTRLVGVAAKRVGQPQVVGEIIAGIVLGPSLFGLLFPQAQIALFPKTSMPIIYTLSQLGLVLYMFLVGLEFDVSLVQRHLRGAASVSVAGIAAPFVLGALLAFMWLHNGTFFAPTVSVGQSMLFLGAAMCVTAFPVLARIILDLGLANTVVGTLSLGAGAANDVAAWCILAVVLASLTNNPVIAVIAVGGTVVFVAAIVRFRMVLFGRLAAIAERDNSLTGGALIIVAIMLLLAACFTSSIGIHAVFGAFVVGMAMPRGILTVELQRRLEPLVVNLLLPLYFVYSGLNTRIGLVNTYFLWAMLGLIVLAACLGKGVACSLAARLTGFDRREALAVGALMNARGLVELIMLNIGLQRGIITPTLFTMMVCMAIITTLLASPLYHAVYGHRVPAGMRRGASAQTV